MHRLHAHRVPLPGWAGSPALVLLRGAPGHRSGCSDSGLGPRHRAHASRAGGGAGRATMKITIENTTILAELNGVPARVWEGKTESGIPVICWITRIAVRS